MKTYTLPQKVYRGKKDPWNLYGTHNRSYDVKRWTVHKHLVNPLVWLVQWYLALTMPFDRFWVIRSKSSRSVYIYYMITAGHGVKIRISDH